MIRTQLISFKSQRHQHNRFGKGHLRFSSHIAQISSSFTAVMFSSSTAYRELVGCQLQHCVDLEIFPIRQEWEAASKRDGKMTTPFTLWKGREFGPLEERFHSVLDMAASSLRFLQRIHAVDQNIGLLFSKGWAEAQHGKTTLDLQFPKPPPRSYLTPLRLCSLSPTPRWE